MVARLARRRAERCMQPAAQQARSTTRSITRARRERRAAAARQATRSSARSASCRRCRTATTGPTSGAAASTWLRDGGAASRPARDVTVELFDQGYPQKSVILTIPGTTRANEVIVIGGHLDSIAIGGAIEQRARRRRRRVGHRDADRGRARAAREGLPAGAHDQVHGVRRRGGRPARLAGDRAATSRSARSTSSARCSST